MLHGDGEGTLLHLTSANVVNQNRLPVVVGNLFFWQLAKRGHAMTPHLYLWNHVLSPEYEMEGRGAEGPSVSARFIRVWWTPDMDIVAVV